MDQPFFDSFCATYFIVSSGLLGAPLLGGLAAWRTRRRVPLAGGRWLVGLSIPAVIVTLAVAFKLSFHSVEADALALAIAYGCYCWATFLLVRARHLPFIVKGWPLLTVPMILGYFVATLGFIALMWTTAEFVPHREIRLGPSFYARVTSYGSAVTPSGIRIAVFRSFAGSWLELRVTGVELPDLGPDDVEIRISATNDREATVTVKEQVAAVLRFR